jgi:hypothetical protein
MLMALVAFGAIGDVIVIIDQTDDLLKRMRAIL